jgi:NTP pyrophosphatase (non-canonical NTP hydrolase)
MEFKEIIKLAEDIIERFRKVEGKPWNAEASMIELTKQVGHLADEIMKIEKYYPENMRNKDYNPKEKIGDELADILYGLIRIAKYYNIDLEKAHIKARKGEDEFLKGLDA